MRIAMFTNTYAPHVGGVARSVATFAEDFRQAGHQVLVVAPVFAGLPANEPDVVRVPAWENFRHSDFSVPLALPAAAHARLEEFAPHIVHAHHPFLLGHSALRLAATRNVPAVFTYHTQYEKYAHYAAGESPFWGNVVQRQAVGFAELCDGVIAPSPSLSAQLKLAGVTRPVRVVPTGIDCRWYAGGEGPLFRRQHGIPPKAFVVGHIGRLAPEKNVAFLAAAVAEFLAEHAEGWFVASGRGSERTTIERLFAERRLSHRLTLLDVLPPDDLRNAYRALNVFAFASQSETQGLVLIEALAAGVPVVAVRSPGVSDVVEDRHNGRLLATCDQAEFAAALFALAATPPEEFEQLRREAVATASLFGREEMASRALSFYHELESLHPSEPAPRWQPWVAADRRLNEEVKIWANVAHSFWSALWPEAANASTPVA